MKKVLVFGGSGLVGSKFIDLYKKDLEIKAPTVEDVDILNRTSVENAVEEFDPDTVINFAAYTAVEEAEKQKGDKEAICYLINVTGAGNIADVCKLGGKHLIHISTEYVFDGTKSESPYTEQDKPNPINWYGQTKYFGEQAVLESGGKISLVRICMPFSSFYELKKDIARFFLGQLKARNPINAVEDQKITPTIVDDIATALKVIANLGVTGIYHVSSTSSTSPFEFARQLADAFNFDDAKIEPVSLDKYNRNKKAKLLKYSWLNPSKFANEFDKKILHSVEEAVRLFRQKII